jgi:hypothetical protein
VATFSGYDDIFVVIWVLVVLSELDRLDHGGTFGSLLVVPVGYWPLFPAKWEIEAHRTTEE